MNLPNAITIGRIASAPVLVALALAPFWTTRTAAFVLFVVAAVTDYYDGKLARSRNLVTDLGSLLDPLADKLLLVATFVPMFMLFATMPFVTSIGSVGLPLWVFLVIVGREVFMTAFRQFAARRGVIISASRIAKWKTGLQWVWVGTSFFWFAFATAGVHYAWTTQPLWHPATLFVGTVGLVTMTGAVTLTVYSLVLYLLNYASLFVRRADHHRG